MSTIEIYAGPDECRHCLGWKKIANSTDGESWKYWAELPSPENLAVQIGVVFPIDCPRCLATGKEPSAAERGLRLQTALAGLQHAWENVSSCTDEFGVDAANACAEYRDQLDVCVLAVVQAWKESQ